MNLSFDTLQAPELEYTVKKIKKSAWGGCVFAEAEIRGEPIHMNQLFKLLNTSVTITDGPEVIWWGHLHSVTALGVKASLSDIANAVCCSYEGVDGGDDLLTDWLVDDDSVQRYGRREKVLEAASRAEADKKTASYLSIWANPKREPTWKSPSQVGHLVFRGEWSRLDQLYHLHQPRLTYGVTEATEPAIQKIGLAPIVKQCEITDSGDDRLISSNLPNYFDDEQIWLAGSADHDGLWKIKSANEERSEIHFTDKTDEEFGEFTIGPDGLFAWQKINPDTAFYLSEIKVKARAVGNPTTALRVIIRTHGPGFILGRDICEATFPKEELTEELNWIGVGIDSPQWMPAQKIYMNIKTDEANTHDGFIIEVDSQAKSDDLKLSYNKNNNSSQLKPKHRSFDDDGVIVENESDATGYSILYELKGAVSVIGLLNGMLAPHFQSVQIELEDTYTSEKYDGSKATSAIVKELLSSYNTSSHRVSVEVDQNDRLFISLKEKPSISHFKYDVTSREIKNAFDIALPASRCFVAAWLSYDVPASLDVLHYWVESSEYDGSAWKPTTSYSIFNER